MELSTEDFVGPSKWVPPKLEILVGNRLGPECPGVAAMRRFLKGSWTLDDLSFAHSRLLTHCLVCCRPLGIRAIRPRICNEDACRFAAGVLGVGVDVEWETKHNSAVVRFVWSTFKAAVASDRFWKDEDFFFAMDPDLKQRCGATPKIRRIALSALKDPAPSILQRRRRNENDALTRN